MPEVILRTAEGLVLRKSLLVLAATLGLGLIVQAVLVDALLHRRPPRLYVPEATLHSTGLTEEVDHE